MKNADGQDWKQSGSGYRGFSNQPERCLRFEELPDIES